MKRPQILPVVFFFLSLHRLHVQLVSAKAEYLARVRRLYAEALAQAEWSLESLASRSPQLNAAETLERRLSTIREWPFDDAVPARLIAIGTSVVATIIARMILSRLGL